MGEKDLGRLLGGGETQTSKRQRDSYLKRKIRQKRMRGKKRLHQNLEEESQLLGREREKKGISEEIYGPNIDN